MPAQKHLSEQVERAYQHRVVKGKTLQETAKVIGVSTKTIERWGKKFGWQNEGLANPKIAQAHQLFVVEGKAPADVATTVGISLPNLIRWIKDFGWKRAHDFRYSYETGKITFAGFRDFLKANHPELSAQIDESIETYIYIQKRYETQVQEKLNAQSHE